MESSLTHPLVILFRFYAVLATFEVVSLSRPNQGTVDACRQFYLCFQGVSILPVAHFDVSLLVRHRAAYLADVTQMRLYQYLAEAGSGAVNAQ